MSDVVVTETAETTPGTALWWRAAVWGAVFLVLAVLGWGLLNTTRTRPEVGSPAPDFTVQFFDGYEWQDRPAADLSEFQGQVVVLNFWASWCIECRLEAELLENAWRQYQDQGVLFLGVAYVDVESKSRAYMEEFNITYPNGPDLRGAISKDYEITGVPETFFIDKNGTIAHITIGPVRAAELLGTIEQLLQ